MASYMAVFIAADIRVAGSGLIEFVRTESYMTLFQSIITSADNRADPNRHRRATAAKVCLTFIGIFPFEVQTSGHGECETAASQSSRRYTACNNEKQRSFSGDLHLNFSGVYKYRTISLVDICPPS